MIHIRVSIKDYQIIRQAVLDFKPGLTVLVGPSNNGKSSIIKAMKAAIYTESGTTPIRNGADSYIVGIQKDNHTVIYQKKEGNTRYVVDGEKYSKFGLNTPEEVKKALNIKEVILNGNKIQLNFWDQMDKPFLLDKSAGELFKFIVDSGENDQLSSVLKSMVSDRQQINREADIVQGSIISTENMIKEQQSILEKTKIILENADKVIDMKDKHDEYESVKHLVDTYTEAENEIKETRPKLLEDLGKFDSYNILDYLIKDKLKEMNDMRNKVKEWNSLNLEEHNEIELKNIISNKENILKNIDIHQNENLRDIVQSYNNIKINIENTSEAILKLEKAIPSNTIIDNLSLLVELKNIKFNIDYMNETIIKEQNNIEELNRKELELDEIRRNIKICPLCGQKIGGEHVHRENVSE